MRIGDKQSWELISRQLSGETTPDEDRKLEGWLTEDPRHQEFYSLVRQAWEMEPENRVESIYPFRYERGLQRLRKKLAVEEREQKLLRHVESRKKVMRMRTWMIAASIIFVILFSSLSSRFYTPVSHEDEFLASYVTTSVEQRIVTLPDGSTVRLNSDSRLDLSSEFLGYKREIHLQGEAYFDIAKDPDRPFIVRVGPADVEVLGTSFNVRQGREIMVAVEHGLVSFRHRERSEVPATELAAGQLGLLADRDATVTVEEDDIANYVGWKNGYLQFDRVPFERVLLQLDRIYEIEHIVESPEISQRLLIAYTETVQLEEVLNTIAMALDLSYSIDGNTVRWRD